MTCFSEQLTFTVHLVVRFGLLINTRKKSVRGPEAYATSREDHTRTTWYQEKRHHRRKMKLSELHAKGNSVVDTFGCRQMRERLRPLNLDSGTGVAVTGRRFSHVHIPRLRHLRSRSSVAITGG